MSMTNARKLTEREKRDFILWNKILVQQSTEKEGGHKQPYRATKFKMGK